MQCTQVKKPTPQSTPSREDIEAQLRGWLNHIPDLFNGAFRRVWAKALTRGGMKAAIRSKCQDCMNWQNSEIKRCSIFHCPLYQYRPGAKKDGDVEQQIIDSIERITCDSRL